MATTLLILWSSTIFVAGGAEVIIAEGDSYCHYANIAEFYRFLGFESESSMQSDLAERRDPLLVRMTPHT